MSKILEDSRRDRILAFLATQTAPVGIGALIAGCVQAGETADATRWTSAVLAIGDDQVEISGNYRKKYALVRTSSQPTDAELISRIESRHPVINARLAEAEQEEAADPEAYAEKVVAYGTYPTIESYDAAAAFFGAAPAETAVQAMLTASKDPGVAGNQMREIVKESLRQESELRGVPEHLLTGAEPPPPEPLADVRIPLGTYFSETFGNFYDASTGFGMGPQFKERWWVRRDEFPTADEYGRNSKEQIESSAPLHDSVTWSRKNTTLEPGFPGPSIRMPQETTEVYRAAVRIRAANAGWGIDAGLDADVREARALLAEVRHQLATDAPLGEHYREGDPSTTRQRAEPPRPASSDEQPWAE